VIKGTGSASARCLSRVNLMISWATSTATLQHATPEAPPPVVARPLPVRPRPLTALVLLNNSGIGGAERRFARVYQGLKRRGFPIALAINESLLARLVRAGILDAQASPEVVLKEPMGRLSARMLNGAGNGKVPHPPEAVAFAWRKLDYLAACFTVREWLARRHPEVMHLVLGGAYVVLPAQFLGKAPPAVLSIVCPSLRGMVGSGLGYRLYRAALHRARTVDALTQGIGDALRGEGVRASRIRVSPGSCVDMDRFQPAAAKRPLVVFSGRFVEEKDPGLFVEACAVVHRLVPEARFLMLGDGPLRGQIHERIRRHGLEDCMQVQWSDAIEGVLSEARVFVSLQRMDNYPSQALLEAMACGAAVVATDVGLTGKLVDEAIGFRVKATPAKVAEAIADLLEHPAHAAECGRRARERVLREHSMEAYLDYLEAIYAEAAGKACSS
jgi:glycosyltransferase involved in cell wall biosynthesis